MLKSALCAGLGTLLGCALAADPPPAQSDPGADDDEPEIISTPDENRPAGGEIDYENAQPMPLPSIPGPPDRKPGIPSADPMPGTAGSSPGDTGDGEEDPEVLIPPKSPPCAD